MHKIFLYRSLPVRSFCTGAKTVVPPSIANPKPQNISIPLSDLDKKIVDKVEIHPITEIPAPQSAHIPSVGTIDEKRAASIDEIPGPTALRVISSAWSYLPIIGTQLTANTMQYLLGAGKLFGSQMSWIGGSWLYRKLLENYGPIVRLPGPFGGNVVILSRPEHVESLFKNEGRFPVRSTLDCVEQYRLKYRQFQNTGPFTMYGTEWEKVRKLIERPLNDSLIKYDDAMSKTCDEFLTRINGIRDRQDKVSKSFKNELYKWSLESLCIVLLDKNLGFLDPCGVSPSSDPGRLLDKFFEATAAVRKMEYGPHFYKMFETWAWKDLKKSSDTIDQILSKHINRAYDTLEKRKTDAQQANSLEITLLENLILKERMQTADIQTIFMDMMLIGVNAVTFTISYLLYYLGKHPRCQIKLHNEIESQKTLNMSAFEEMPYLKACIKECLRLKPPIPLLSRTLTHDVVINNYHIPKDTFILVATHLTSVNEEYFDDPKKFMPERWLKDEMKLLEHQMYTTIPFGYGAKACLGKQMAQMQICYLITKILKRYRVEYHYGPVESSFDKFLSPQKRPSLFTLIDR